MQKYVQRETAKRLYSGLEEKREVVPVFCKEKSIDTPGAAW